MDKPPPAPAALKPIQPYIVLHKQFFKRDPVIAYYAKMYAVQEGIKLAHDPESKGCLLGMMDELDQMKKGPLIGEEALQSDIVAQAHIEEVGLKLFDYADTEDRAGRFSRNMIKSFLTSAHIFTTLKQFGEIQEEVEGKMKYAKWKAVEIDRCLKNGITPTPGPPGGSDQGSDEGAVGGYDPTPTYPSGPGDASTSYPLPGEKPVPKPRQNLQTDLPPPTGFNITPDPQPTPPSYTPSAGYGEVPSTGMGAMATGGGGGGFNSEVPSTGMGAMAIGGGFKPGQKETARAQKLIKFASSALDYDDVPGSIDFMNKAIKLLRTGKE